MLVNTIDLFLSINRLNLDKFNTSLEYPDIMSIYPICNANGCEQYAEIVCKCSNSPFLACRDHFVSHSLSSSQTLHQSASIYLPMSPNDEQVIARVIPILKDLNNTKRLIEVKNSRVKALLTLISIEIEDCSKKLEANLRDQNQKLDVLKNISQHKMLTAYSTDPFARDLANLKAQDLVTCESIKKDLLNDLRIRLTCQ